MNVQLSENKIKEVIDTKNLDQELIEFEPLPFTTSSCNFIVVSIPSSSDFGVRREESVERVFALINELEKSYPPEPNTDISGIEEIYE
ncbi:MAG: hypothetical protein AAB706_00945 [Patescibacteria group bacterium]